jgi:hypothetical protein
LPNFDRFGRCIGRKSKTSTFALKLEQSKLSPPEDKKMSTGKDTVGTIAATTGAVVGSQVAGVAVTAASANVTAAGATAAAATAHALATTPAVFAQFLAPVAAHPATWAVVLTNPVGAAVAGAVLITGAAVIAHKAVETLYQE